MPLETPNMLRGELYSTHLFQRCPSFKPCGLCMRCRNYCKHHQQCILCESRKTNPVQRLCDCTERQRLAKIQIEEYLKAPLFQPGKAKEGTVHIQDTSEIQDWDRLADSLRMRPEEV